MNKALPFLIGGGIILAAVVLTKKSSAAENPAPNPNPKPTPAPTPSPTPGPAPTPVNYGGGGGMYSATQIKCAQAALLAGGFFQDASGIPNGTTADVDAAVGPRTEAALKLFQISKGLPVTGFLNTATMAALGCP